MTYSVAFRPCLDVAHIGKHLPALRLIIQVSESLVERDF